MSSSSVQRSRCTRRLATALFATATLVACDSATPPAAPEPIEPSAVTGNFEGGWGPPRLFDGSIGENDFAETNSIPAIVDVQFAEAERIMSYSIAAGELTARMPNSWQVLSVSADGATHVLDQQTGITDWQPNAAKEFNIATPVATRAIRLEFTSSVDPNILRIYEISFKAGG